MRAVALLVLCCSLAACKRSKEIDCGAAARAWVELAQADLARDQDPDRQASARAVLPALREALSDRCNAEAWPLAVRKCIAAARSADALERCDPAAAAATAPDPAAAETAPPTR